MSDDLKCVKYTSEIIASNIHMQACVHTHTHKKKKHKRKGTDLTMGTPHCALVFGQSFCPCAYSATAIHMGRFTNLLLLWDIIYLLSYIYLIFLFNSENYEQ